MGNISDLNERQIECLELVSQGTESSKEIARRTGLSPSSVDNYLSRAAKILGVGNRRDAATVFNRLRELDSSSVSQSVSRFSRLARVLRISVDGLAAGTRWLFSVPPVGGRKHNFNRIEILLLILKVALVSFTFLLALVLLGAGLLWALR